MNANKDSDYDEKELGKLRCWLWGVWEKKSSNSADIKSMGGINKCTTELLGSYGAKVHVKNLKTKKMEPLLMTDWYP